MLQKWICNKCKNEIEIKPKSKNSICKECKSGRFQCWNLCKCGKHTIDLEAHHIKEQSRYPELIYELSNGLTLCHKCHKLTDNYGYKARWKNLQAEKIE